jgi:hypothetical protein
MTGRKLAITRFCARVERWSARMNSGLAAVALVLATMTLLLGVARVADDLNRDGNLLTLPFIEMSTDGPDTGSFSMTD